MEERLETTAGLPERGRPRSSRGDGLGLGGKGGREAKEGN